GAEEEARLALTGKLKDLLEEKRGIKAQLKNFDSSFFDRTGRVPTKAEKEPMRHLYDRYNGLKHQIRDVEGLLVSHRQQHSPQLQYTPPQSPYTASPRGVWTGGADPNASNTTNASTNTANASTNTNATPTTNLNINTNTNTNTNPSNGIELSLSTPTQQRWGSGPSSLGISPSGSSSSTRVGAIVGSPISVAGAVAASA
ncbi:unnamed protein product, partial [Laminaria digitata]